MRKSLFLLLALWLLGTSLVAGSVHADWAYDFVVNEGKSYIVTDDQVEADQIGSVIGNVTSYSDQEGTYSGNFSNHFPKGTEYYKIEGVDTRDAIAIKIREVSFIKADYRGEYAGPLFTMDWGRVLWYVAAGFLLVIVIVTLKVNWK